MFKYKKNDLYAESVPLEAIARKTGVLVLGRARDKGKTARCQSNLKQLGLAGIMYEEERQVYPVGWPPTTVGNLLWYQQLQPYLGRKTTVSGEGVTMKEIRQESGKPEKELRAILNEIGSYHRSGEFKNMWSLKTEFNNNSGGSGAVGDADDGTE